MEITVQIETKIKDLKILKSGRSDDCYLRILNYLTNEITKFSNTSFVYSSLKNKQNPQQQQQKPPHKLAPKQYQLARN